MMKEIDVTGLFITPLLAWGAEAVVGWWLLGRLIDRSGLARWIWHRGLFDAALFVVVLGGVAAVARWSAVP